MNSDGPTKHEIQWIGVRCNSLTRARFLDPTVTNGYSFINRAKKLPANAKSEVVASGVYDTANETVRQFAKNCHVWHTAGFVVCTTAAKQQDVDTEPKS